ncbi:MAG TPA: Nramp family divalent metal transporter [Anaerolineaceae bacterium]|jgi:Mn2+/Fe2+ NRAMP family transporter
MNALSKTFYRYRRLSKIIKLFLIIAGPGIIVMVADNDAGGITTYAATGSKYGYDLIWFLVLLGPIAYFVQEMTVRLGAVTKRGHAEAIFDAFGSFWGWFSFFDLGLTNQLTLITEFIGMTSALSIFGIPPLLTVIIVILLMGAMVLQGKYWTWEKIAIVFCLVNLIYIPAAFMVHPDVNQVLRNGMIPHFPAGSTGELFFFLMANVGTTIAPWMIFFQQSSVVDKGMKEKDIPWAQFDTIVGAFFTVLVAIFCVIVTATVLRGVDIQSAAQAATMLMPINKYVGTFLAIGLFDAGFLGAICISLATSWAIGEVFGWAHSLNLKVREAPWFYAYYFLSLLIAGVVVLIPNAPLVLITLFVQVIATTLLPATMVFLILLLNNEELMGSYKNNRVQNIINFSIVIGLIILSTAYSLSALFPNLFK